MNQIFIIDFPLKFTRDFLIQNYKGIHYKMDLDKKKERKKKRKDKRREKKERKKKKASLARAVPLTTTPPS